MIVLDTVRDPEASRRAEIAVLEDDSLREDHAGIRFGACYLISDRAAFDLDVLTASEARLDAVERKIVRGGVGPVHLRPRPAEDPPRPSGRASEKDFNRRALRSICARIDQDKGLAVALMDCAGPVDVNGEAQPMQFDVAIGALLDVPRPAPFAFSGGRSRIEIAGTAPIAVARDEDFSAEMPALCHVKPSDRRDDRVAAAACQGRWTLMSAAYPFCR